MHFEVWEASVGSLVFIPLFILISQLPLDFSASNSMVLNLGCIVESPGEFCFVFVMASSHPKRFFVFVFY